MVPEKNNCNLVFLLNSSRSWVISPMSALYPSFVRFFFLGFLFFFAYVSPVQWSVTGILVEMVPTGLKEDLSLKGLC